MKLLDMIISAIIKKGILYEAQNVDVEFTIPNEKQVTEILNTSKDIKVHVTADHMSVAIEKD